MERRCRHELVRDLLSECQFSRRPLSRVAAGCGINYAVASGLVQNGLLKLVELEGRRTRRRQKKRPTVAVLTAEGQHFLEIIAELEGLMPKQDKLQDS